MIGRYIISVRADQIPSARMNGHDPWTRLNDVLRCLPNSRSRVAGRLPHIWVIDRRHTDFTAVRVDHEGALKSIATAIQVRTCEPT